MTKIPTELITDEMRAAGVDENTDFLTREEMVEKLGEEKVAEIEATAVPAEEAEMEATADAPAEEAPAESTEETTA